MFGSLILSTLVAVASAQPVQLGNVTVPAQFCEGIRAVGQYDGSYKDFLDEHALDHDAANSLAEMEKVEAIKDGASEETTLQRAQRRVAAAKAEAAAAQAKNVKAGQAYLCGSISNNW